MAVFTANASAATLTWGASGEGGNGTWTDANAWYDGSSQTWNSAAPDSGVFGGTAGTVSLTTTATAQDLQFSTTGYTVSSGVLNIKGVVTVDSEVATVSSAISGTGFTKSGPGVLRISNTSSSFTGTTSITAGTLAWTSPGRNSFARGKRAYDIAAGATLKLDAGGTINFGSSATGTTTLTGGGVFNVAAGTVFTSDNNNSGNVVMSLGPGAQIVVDGVMGASQIWLSSTYTRGLTFYANNKADLVINAGGRFNAQYSSALATPSLDIVVNSLLGSGTFDKSQPDPTNLKVGIANGSGTFAGSFIANSNGTNYMSSLTLIKVGTGTQTLSGTAAPGITFNVQEGGLLIDGTMSSDAGVSGMTTVSPGAVFGGTGLLGGSLTFASGSSMFLFNPTAPLTVGGAVTFADPATFGVANLAGLTSSVANGTYSLIAGNVTTTGLANFGSANAFNLGGGKSAYFDEVPGSLFRLVVGPGGGITINVASGTQTQTQAGYPLLAGTTPVEKTGSGTLVLDQANTLTGSTTVQNGRLQLANGSALSGSRVVPLAGGTVTLSPALQTTVGGLAPNAGGLTDVGNGLVTVSSGLSAADMVTALVTGRGDGSWNGTSGITSSIAAASGGDRTVGWLDNGDGSVTFAFAAAGDTNLDWQVDILDASNFLAGGKFDSGSPASWNEGDFTYDGFVDILDAASFLSAGLFDAGSYNAASGSAAAVAAVPEPASLAAAAMGALVCLLLRRRPRVAVMGRPSSRGHYAMGSFGSHRAFMATIVGGCLAALPAAASAATLTWGTSGTGGVGGWMTANAWYDGSAQATWSNATPDSGVFAGTAGTVTVTTATAQNLRFSTSGYTVSSGTLNIKGGVTVDSGTAIISSAISGTGFAKLGAGVLRISNTSSSFTGTTSITSGTLAWTSTGRNSFARGSRAYDIPAGSTLKLDAGGTINFGSSATGTTTLTGGGVFNVAAGTTFTSDNATSGNVVMSLGSGAQIVVDGVLGSSQIWNTGTQNRGYTYYANNKADLVISAGGRFTAQYSNALATPSQDIIVNALLGSGTFDKSQPDPTNVKVGIDNGSGIFSGNFINNTNQLTFIKLGTGTQTLSGTGPGMIFQAQAGGLIINGTMGSGGLTTVSPGAVFGGTGLLSGSLTFASGSSMFLFNPAAPLTVGSGVTFGDASTFGVANLAGLTNSVADGTYTLISGSVTTTGLANFGPSNAYDLGAGKSAYFDSVPGSMFQLVVVPEPSAAFAIGVAIAAIARFSRRNASSGL